MLKKIFSFSLLSFLFFSTNIAQATVIINLTSDVNKDFTGNKGTHITYVLGSTNLNAGAIYNSNTNGYNISGNFTNNSTESIIGSAVSYDSFYGGAIANNGGYIGNIKGSFTENYVSGVEGQYGGAIANINGIIDTINAHFTGNYITIKTAGLQSNPDLAGGAIYNDNYSTIGNII